MNQLSFDMIVEFFKTTFQNEFQTTMTGDRIAVGLLVSFFVSLFITLIYRITYHGVAFNRNFSLSLILLSMVTSAIIMTVTTNLTLSLGMVGALSIVRFRTAVKDPSDTVFMFWAVSVGIMAGAGLVYISLITNLGLGLLYLLYYLVIKSARSAPYLLVVRYRREKGEDVELALGALKKMKVKSKNASGDVLELCLETKMTPELLEIVESLGQVEGVLHAGVVSFGAQTTL
ncbi:MAG: DUF4956 domain-containing protein [Clostridia bacterium]|nr:DUF4956 domain-containing protein [Clostridia bacterium]